ncbi:MAG: DUF975 family protein [Oscillibacter sp.]|jgi:uncharacterized membrane protein|nr:DUF975 family protein [uncultured Oscillibacter sp.]MCI8813455.1 DUF975 family protein [Oscillibacter sp.]
MMAELIDRKRLKAETRELLGTARVSPRGMTALYLGLAMALSTLDYLAGGGNAVLERNPVGIFTYVLTTLLTAVLGAGFSLYCMAVRRGERAECLTLFDGFSFVGKLIALNVVESLLIILWSMLFVIPGIVAAYRYRFALYNLYENPGIGVMEALDMSKRQTWGYKSQIFALDWSYFGWLMLASLPLLAVLFLLYRLVFQIVTGPMPALPAEELVDQALVLPVWAWSLIASVFSLVVGLFYVPNRECVELGYFEIAKRTSGVGWNAAPPRPEDNPNSGWTGGWGQM